MRGLTAGRSRAFHWRREGPEAHEAAITLIEEHATAAVIVARCAGRRGQIEARAALMAELALEVASHSVGHLVIESRGPREDGRDRSVLLDCFRQGLEPAFTYDWRMKAEPCCGTPTRWPARPESTSPSGGRRASAGCGALGSSPMSGMCADKARGCVSPGSRPRRLLSKSPIAPFSITKP